jgi:hypothetical protein
MLRPVLPLLLLLLPLLLLLLLPPAFACSLLMFVLHLYAKLSACPTVMEAATVLMLLGTTSQDMRAPRSPLHAAGLGHLQVDSTPHGFARRDTTCTPTGQVGLPVHRNLEFDMCAVVLA